MDTLELLHRLSVALAIGLLIGIERGWQARAEPEGGRAAGLRTYALSGLLGGVWGALLRAAGASEWAQGAGLIALAVAFAIFSIVLAFFRYREIVHDRTYGATTVVAAMLSFALGALAVAGDMVVAAAAGVATAGLLASKAVLHSWLERLTWAELRSALVLLAMTFVVLPLLPDTAIDPWGAIRPREIWLMTVVVAAISFVGYVAIRVAGERAGIVLTGIAGGLASSTAVTVTMAKLAKDNPDQRDPLLAGAVLSSAMMMARVAVVAGLINAHLLDRLLVPLGLAGLALAGCGAWLLGPSRGQSSAATAGLALDNPFEIESVLKFGLLLTVVSALAKIAATFGGSAGAYTLAAISGIADVDALTVSMARSGVETLGVTVAANAILIVVLVNTVSKAVLGAVTGGREAGIRLGLAAIAAIAAGFAGVTAMDLVLGG